MILLTEFTPTRNTYQGKNCSYRENLPDNQFCSILVRLPIPKRERLGEEFVKEAFDTHMKNVSRLFGMADSISFSKENVNYDLTASLEFYTHVVVKRGMSLAP